MPRTAGVPEPQKHTREGLGPPAQRRPLKAAPAPSELFCGWLPTEWDLQHSFWELWDFQERAWGSAQATMLTTSSPVWSKHF